MIEKDYTLKITTTDAEANLKQLNSTLDEQREILIMLEKDLLKVQQTQNKTSKTNLEAQRRLTKQADHLKDAIKDQRLGLRTLNTERRQATSAITELNKGSKEQTAIVSGIDKLTGGYATKVINLKKGLFSSIKVLKGFATGLKGIQKALIATGIGAIAVGIGLIVAYWDDIKALVNGVSVEQQSLLDSTKKTLETQEEQLKTTSSMENTLKLQGKSEKEIRDLKRQQTDEIIASTELLLEQQKQQKKSQIEAAERNQNITKGIIAFLTAPIVVLLGLVDGLTNSLATLGILDEGTKLTEGFLELSSSMLFDPKEVEEEADKTIDATEKKLLELKNKRDGFLLADKKDREKTTKENNDAEIKAEKEKAAALERIRKGLIDTEAERRAEKLREIQQDYDEQIALAAKFYGANSIQILQLKAAQKAAIKAQEDAFALEDKEKEDKKEKERLAKIKENADKEAKIAEALNQQKRDLVDANLNTVASGFALLGQLAGKNKALQAAAIIGESAVGIAKSVIDTTASNVAITAQGAALAIPSGGTSVATAAALVSANNIMSGIGIAANIASTAKALSALKAGGGAPSPTSTNVGGGGSSVSIPPAFNIVGASGESQLADAIGGQTQRPSRAYVVSSDVSTAQELDRNIIEGASIG